jgi:hypothetical protein
MKDLTITQVKSYGFRHPDMILRYGETPELTKQINAIRYVEHLAGVTKTDIASLPLGHFLNSNGNMIVERTELNRVFFKLRENLTETPRERAIIPRERLLEIEEYLRAALNRACDKRELEVRGQFVRVQTKARALQEEKRILVERKLSLMALEKARDTGPSLSPQVQKVLDRGFYTLSSGSGLSFVTEPITLSYYNMTQGRENVAFMGKYIVDLKFENGFSPRVYAFLDNLSCAGCVHPHVGPTGLICFGDQQSAAETYAANLDLVSLMELIKDVLTVYCDKNPYAYLHVYQELRSAKMIGKRIAETPINPIEPEDVGLNLDEEPEEEDEEEDEENEDEENNDESF